MKLDRSFFNLSLDSLFKNEPDFFLKAKYKILTTVFIFAFIKGSLAIGTALYSHQDVQLIRALIYLIVYIILFYCFLSKILSFKTVAHTVIIGSLILVYTNLVINYMSINIATLQFAFTLVLCSFYILNSRFGFTYSILGIIPIVYSLLFREKFKDFSGLGELASPGYEIIVIVNFFTIIYIPYLFYQGFIDTLKEKEVLNLQLQSAVKSANEAVVIKSNFLSTMSHELRTPLNTVIGTTDLLLSDSYEPHQAENLKDLKFSANTLLTIINDILDYNKLESSKLTLENIKVDLVKLINTVCSGLHKQASDKNISLNLEIDDEIDKYDVVTDPTRIAQIFYNLIGNGIKFTSKGEVLTKLTVINKTKDELTIRFMVKDTGIGIREDMQESVFEPFNQASTSITRQFGGTGLGLSIVKRLVTLFNSKIELSSNREQGSSFCFDIRFKYFPKTDKITTRKSLETVSVKDISDLKVLIAEDNLMNRVLIKKVFERWNNVPVFAENGQEAVEIAAKTKFDVILMDLHMPIMDGYSAAKAIKYSSENINKSTYIIAFTASISDEILKEVNACGMEDYIYKPFDASEMYQKIRSVHPIR